MNGLSSDALAVYAQNIGRLAQRFEAVDSNEVFAPLADMLPDIGTMLDVGAGTGRDAAWFAARGHVVTAVEPTEGLRHVAKNRPGAPVDWLDDALPHLARLDGRRFDLVLVNSVWHHLDAGERNAAIARLADLTTPGGRMLLSLRLGPALLGQPVERIVVGAEIHRAKAAGFALVEQRHTESVQAENRVAGVMRCWLVLDRPSGEPA